MPPTRAWFMACVILGSAFACSSRRLRQVGRSGVFLGTWGGRTARRRHRASCNSLYAVNTQIKCCFYRKAYSIHPASCRYCRFSSWRRLTSDRSKGWLSCRRRSCESNIPAQKRLLSAVVHNHYRNKHCAVVALGGACITPSQALRGWCLPLNSKSKPHW